MTFVLLAVFASLNLVNSNAIFVHPNNLIDSTNVCDYSSDTRTSEPCVITEEERCKDRLLKSKQLQRAF